MLELLFTILLYFLDMPLWWVLGGVVFINKFVHKPLTFLYLFSPVFWIYGLFEISRFENKRGLLYSFEKMNWNLPETLLYILFSLLVCFALYWLAINLYKRVDREKNHPLLFAISFFLFIHTIEKCIQNYYPNAYAQITWMIVYIFFANAFVIMVYELRDVGQYKSVNIFKRFLLLNTLHASYMPQVGTQLSPRGINHLLSSKITENNELIKIKKQALKVLAVCLGLKVTADLIEYLFLGIDIEYLARLNLPVFELIDLKHFKTLPRFAVLEMKIESAKFTTMLILRDISWLARKILQENQKICILWFFGFFIELGAHNPLKATSFADFFRRIHVYLAHFYRTFIYPYCLQLLSFYNDIKIRKYIAIWLMIFFGGIIHQSISHFYQLVSWKADDLYNLFISRIFYDSAMASIICVSVYCDKHRMKTPRLLKPIFLMSYILIYTFLMSIHASTKNRGFDLEMLFSYFKLLIGQ